MSLMDRENIIEEDICVDDLMKKDATDKKIVGKEGYNFVLCGDSISKGIAYDEEKEKYIILEKSYSNILQTKLRGVIYNAAKFGNTALRAAGRFQNDVLKKDPDVVLIEFGGNDCDFNWEEIAQNPLENHNPNTDLTIFGKSMRSLIELLKNTGIVPVLMTLPPLDVDRYFKWISKNNSQTGEKIMTWLGSVNKIYWWQERYNSAIISIAQETGTRWIDIRGAFLEISRFQTIPVH